MEKAVTGVMIYYYAVCKRKLWYFYHNINMEQNNENVSIGKVIDETSYLRDKKHINIDNVINIDFIRESGILHEVKKSKKIEEASVLQVKYYLYYLESKGVYVKAKIDYPIIKKCELVELSDEDRENIKIILNEISAIVTKNTPPEIKKRNICKSCAYFDLCYI